MNGEPGLHRRLFQRRSDVRHRLKAIARLLGQAPAHDFPRAAGASSAGSRGLSLRTGSQTACRRQMPGGHSALRRDRAEGEHVRARVHSLPLGLLRRHIGHCADDGAVLAQRHAHSRIARQHGRSISRGRSRGAWLPSRSPERWQASGRDARSPSDEPRLMPRRLPASRNASATATGPFRISPSTYSITR